MDIKCPRCGTTNRIRGLGYDKKAVCGNCKTVLKHGPSSEELMREAAAELERQGAATKPPVAHSPASRPAEAAKYSPPNLAPRTQSYQPTPVRQSTERSANYTCHYCSLGVSATPPMTGVVHAFCGGCGRRYRISRHTPRELYNADASYLHIICAKCYSTNGSGDGAREDKVVVPCWKCRARLEVDGTRLPPVFFAENVEQHRSANGSAVAFFTEHDLLEGDAELENIRAVVMTAKTTQQLDVIADVTDKVDALRQLREYETRTRREFDGDPALLEAFDRLIARKKRTIMGNPD